MKKCLIVLLAVLSAAVAYAQQQDRRNADWAGFDRYAEANASVERSPLGVFMGDSITDFWVTNRPSFFEDHNYLGRGISGQTVEHMLARFQQDVVDLHPRAVVILAGINNIAGNNGKIDFEDIVACIKSMCDIARANGIVPVLCSLTPCHRFFWNPGVEPAEDVIRLNGMYEAYARGAGIEYVDYFKAMALPGGRISETDSSDGCHPTAAGYEKMEAVVQPVLERILAAPAAQAAPARSAGPVRQMGPQDWPNFKRYEEKNAALTQAPLLVLMGDSITDFWYDNDPDFFERNNFAGRGISGQTASQMLTRFKQDVINLKPKAVAIMAGTNDLCQNMASQAYYPDQTIFDNTVAMCELAEDAGIKVLLCSITPCAHYMILPDIDAGSIIEAFNARLKAYADSQKNVTYVDYFTPLANAEKGLDDDCSYDGIHPAVNIYDDMERILVDAVKKVLKLKNQDFYTLPSDEADRRKVESDAERKARNLPMNFNGMVEMLGIDRTAGTVGNGNPDKPKVSVGKLDFYPAFESKSGLITPRNVYVWVPDNYSRNKKYAVVYMSDGQNLFDPEKMFNHQEWRVDEVFGGLIKEGKIQDCIVVGVANVGRTRSQEYFPQDILDLYSPELKEYSRSKRMGEDDLLGNAYLKFLVEELKPFIDRTYSTYTDRDHTFHMGSSMGGLISSYAVTKYPDVFGGAGCLSTHSILYITDFDADKDSIDSANQCYVDYLKANLKPNSCKMYMDRGDQTLDAQYPKYQDRLDRMFKDAGWDDAHYVSRVFPGLEHVENSWASRLDIPVVYLLGK